MKNPSRCYWRTTVAKFFILLQSTNLAFATLPNIDFNRMGHVGLAGTFAGLDLFDNSSSLSFDPTTSTLLSRASDGSLTRLGSTEAGGKINAGCSLGSSVYFAGSFSSVNGTSASNVVSFSVSEGTFSALGSGGPDGEVRSIFCDDSHKKIWVGGTFSSPGKSVAVWDTQANSWSAPPFGGLSGGASEVLSITTNSSSESLFFAGSFVVSFGSNTSTVVNGSNNPNVPFSSGATPFSSSLVPIPLQGAEIDAEPPSSDSDFSNINNTLCPSGPDGPGSTWLAADGFKAVITVRKFVQLNAVGIRLGNTFQSNHGTTGFSITSIPDNTVQTLTFIDPTTGANNTCTDPCPLSTDSSIPYQDFLFTSDVELTGFQLTLSEWTGAGPGLHLLQLLSSGAFASAVASQNGISCFAPNPSNITLVGEWTEKQVTTDIAGTIQDVLTASVDVGTSPQNGPSITWMPYVSASGNYNVNMLIPGCTEFQDCGARTSVQVTVFPGGGLDPKVTIVSQQVSEDSSQNIYSGPVFPSSPNFVATVTMSLADDPAGNGENGKYELIADRIELQLLSVTGNFSSNSTSVVSNSTNTRTGFGFFEWPLSETSTVNAATTLPNTTETTLDNVAFQLFNAIGSNAASSNDVITAVAHHSSGAIFLGGNFSLSTGSNIVAFKNGGLTNLSANGLNGPVTSLVIDGNTLYVGGSFTDTASSSTGGKARGVVSYDVNGDSWIPLEAGVDGTVAGLNIANNQIEVVGSFSTLLSSASGAGSSANGLGVWNISDSTWSNSGGYLVGSMSFVGNSTSPGKNQEQATILAGNVISSLKFGATGFVLLQNGNNGVPTVSTLGVQLQDSGNTTSTTSTKKRRAARNSIWPSNLGLRGLFKRQSTTPGPLPSDPIALAPAVLAGAFWTNTSDSQDTVILGGNFSLSDGSSDSSGVLLYNLNTGSFNSLEGNPINGTVRSLLVAGDTLYIGGDFTISGNSGTGFAIYDLSRQTLDMSGLSALQASSGSKVVVRSLTASASNSNTIIVAGSFATAGGVTCAGICQLDATNNQWKALGSGINGEVANVAYGGTNQDLLFASGSIALSDGTSANVAMFSFDNSSWTAVGSSSEIPGPVTAITLDNGNSSSIFAAGRSSDGLSSFLTFWNGKTWNSLNSGFEGTTNVSQLTMVPLQDQHDANSIIESDRMLLVSGAIASSSFGNASSVLFDGESFIPYIKTSTEAGLPGLVSSLFSSIQNFSFTQRQFLAVGVVILISIAIAAGVIFLLVLLGILWTLFARRDNSKVDVAVYEDDDDSMHQRPSSLLEHINAATRGAIVGTPPFETSKSKSGDEDGPDPFISQDHDDDNFRRAETPSDAIGGIVAEEQGRPAHARYSFDGAGDGELPLEEGMNLEILDDRDVNWWYARDVTTGREGVVPASYVM